MNKVEAQYTMTEVSRYDDNPFITALPPILKPKDLIKALRSDVDISSSDKQASPTLRVHMLVGLMNSFFQPITRHIDLEKRISVMIREGYVGRNLANGKLAHKLQSGYEQVKSGAKKTFVYSEIESTASSLSFLGCSGSGKTTSMNRILSMYPQRIYHRDHNFTQIVYLKMDCPHDGSLKSLCLNFFQAIDRVLNTEHEKVSAKKRQSINNMMTTMSDLAGHYAIGLLVIDEIQHLSISRSGGAEKMLNFFVTLINTVNLPIIMIGTPKARFIFEGDFRSARRGAGFGSIFWEQMKEEPNLLLAEGKIHKSEWNAFTERLWKFQWLEKADITLSEEVRTKWYELSQGILDIVVKLFILAQFRAIESSLERITVNVLVKAYEEDLKPIHPMIRALQSGIPNRIAEYSDLVIPEIDKKILRFQESINEKLVEVDEEAVYQGHEPSIILHRLLKDMGYDSSLLPSVVTQIFKRYPDLEKREAVRVAMDLLLQDRDKISNKVDDKKSTSTSKRTEKVRKNIHIKDWHTLDNDDLRFQFSQKADDESLYTSLKKYSSIIFDIEAFVQAG